MIFIVKVTTNKEDKAVEMIAERAEKKNLNVYSIVRAQGLKGYVFLEAQDKDSAEAAAYDLPYVKGMIGKTITYEEVKTILQPKIEDIKIEVGDIVEIIIEPFKNKKAKVTRVDKGKGEVIVSLLEASFPIPVSVKIDNVKVIRREEKIEEIKKEEKSGE